MRILSTELRRVAAESDDVEVRPCEGIVLRANALRRVLDGV